MRSSLAISGLLVKGTNTSNSYCIVAWLAKPVYPSLKKHTPRKRSESHGGTLAWNNFSSSQNFNLCSDFDHWIRFLEPGIWMHQRNNLLVNRVWALIQCWQLWLLEFQNCQRCLESILLLWCCHINLLQQTPLQWTNRMTIALLRKWDSGSHCIWLQLQAL